MALGEKFVADAMLGSLARKMRIIGLDVNYFREGPDSEIETIARQEVRVILTGDRALYVHAVKVGLRSVLVTEKTDARRLAQVVKEAQHSSIDIHPGDSRCASCNVPLVVVEKKDVPLELKPGTRRLHRVYYRCPSCGGLFWKGSHWRRLGRIVALVPRE